MNIVRSKDDFIDYCLRQLGEPVIQVNVDQAQAEDRVNDALQMYFFYHNDGSYKDVITVKLTQEDIDNQSVTLPPDVIGLSEIVYQPSSSFANTNLQYQAYFSDLISKSFAGSNAVGGGLSTYVNTKSYLSMLSQIIGDVNHITDFKLHSNQVRVHYNWSKVNAGDLMGFEVQRMMEPDNNPNIWNDYWLKQYATALIRIQWGTNLMKYSGPGLPGGGQLNGADIYQAGMADKDKLEDRLYNEFQLPAYGYMA